MPKGVYTRKPFTEEQKRNMGAVQVGRKRSAETKRKMSLAHLGRKRSTESIEKTKQALTGKKRPPRSDSWRKNMSSALKGDKSRLWKGGITDIPHKERNGVENTLWREKVLNRDNHQCQKCGKTGITLVAHHILNFTEHVALRYEIDNGLTLCVGCHNAFHKLFGTKTNTKLQLMEFIGDGKVIGNSPNSRAK